MNYSDKALKASVDALHQLGGVLSKAQPQFTAPKLGVSMLAIE